MNWWHYLLLANLYLALFYGFYLLLLRNETYFMLNRIYLVSAAVLSFFIPMMQAEWVRNLFITQKVQQTIYYIDPGFVYQVSPQTESGFTIAQFFTSLYWLVTMLLLARLIYRFVKLKRYLQSTENGSAFSFFGKVKVDENLPQKDVILQHEMVHVAQLHSVDVLLFEALTILNWFNPVIYFYRKAIKHIHEFIADRDAISFGIDKSDYALLLLSESMGVQPNHLVNSFFNQSLLKQRIMMLHKNPSRRAALLKYGLSAPLFAAMLILTSATVSEQKTIRVIADKISSDAPVKEVASDFKNEINASAKIISTKKNVVKTVSVLKGKVVDPNGKPLVGVKIFYAKRSITVASDNDGDFKINNYYEGDLVSFNPKDKGYDKITKGFKNVNGKLSVVVLHTRFEISLVAPSIKPDSSTAANTPPTFPRGQAAFNKFLSTNTKPTYRIIDRLPTFPGGQEAFSKYLVRAIRYPKEARDNKIEGRVIVSFFVEKDGKLSELKVLRDVGGGLGAEALHVLAASPAWIPGSNEGKPLRVAYTMPINFSLDGKIKKMPNQLQLDSAKNPERYKKMMATIQKMDNITMSGFGGKDSARQRPPADVVRIQSKIMGIDPIYMLDGKEVDKDILNKTNANDIESISVYKGATATAKYGDKAKNGVVEITMKKGKKP